MNLTCEWLSRQAFLNCYPVTTMSGEQGISVQTNHLWNDRSPLSFFIIPQGDKLLLTDEGESLFHFHLTGILENRKSWKGVQERLDRTLTPISLESDGEILCLTTEENAPFAIADYISALCAVMHYEYELLGVPKDVVKLADEVEYYLRTWKPTARLIKSPKVQGISGHTYEFDFQFDEQLIFAIQPTPNAVGSVMRKTGDILSGSHLDDRKILVIVDDRSDDLFQQKAEEEIQIISSLAKAVPLTNLIKLAHNNLTMQ